VQVAGSSLADATEKLVELARARAAEVLEAAVEDVVLDDGGFHVVGSPTPALSWADIASAPGEALAAVSDFKAAQPTYPFGAHVAVVDVDRETGKVTLRRIIALDDAGTLVNPLLAEGQFHGGLGQGIAQALMEEQRFDESGNPVTSNFADYPVISAAELPSFEMVHMETPTWVNPLGAKGAGESGTIGSIPTWTAPPPPNASGKPSPAASQAFVPADTARKWRVPDRRNRPLRRPGRQSAQRFSPALRPSRANGSTIRSSRRFETRQVASLDGC
jgi:CO/xanthine dehydrogenase Mo-binding subunit